MESILLEVNNLSVNFELREGVARILNGFSLSIPYKGRVGLLGESGVGKSVAAWSILNLVKPPGKIVEGAINYKGADLLLKSEGEMQQLRGKEIALIVPRAHSQLNPLLTIGKHLSKVYFAHGTGDRKDAELAAIKMLIAVGMDDPKARLSAYPHELSGGMAQRIIIAMALMHNPELIIADDPTAGLDVTIQAQIMDLLNNLVHELGTSALIMTHHLGLVAQHCDQIAVMYAGQIVELAPTIDFFESPIHPYSRALLSSVEGGIYKVNRLNALIGRPADPKNLPAGCFLNPRCDMATQVCKTMVPPFLRINDNRMVRCHECTRL